MAVAGKFEDGAVTIVVKVDTWTQEQKDAAMALVTQGSGVMAMKETTWGSTSPALSIQFPENENGGLEYNGEFWNALAEIGEF